MPNRTRLISLFEPGHPVHDYTARVPTPQATTREVALHLIAHTALREPADDTVLKVLQGLLEHLLSTTEPKLRVSILQEFVNLSINEGITLSDLPEPTDPITRVCRTCGETKDLQTGFYQNGWGPGPEGEPPVPKYRRECRQCFNGRRAASRTDVTPEEIKAIRDRINANARAATERRKNRDPELHRARNRERQARYRENHPDHYREYQRTYQAEWQRKRKELAASLETATFEAAPPAQEIEIHDGH